MTGIDVDPRRTQAQLAALRECMARFDSVVVAFSAGVDSTLVLKLATDVLGERALGVMGIAPSVAPAEAEHAQALATALGARLHFAQTHEMDDPDYVANPSNRCFFCKRELYSVCRRVAARQGIATILNGTNADDLGDWRPGLAAADDAGVRSPLLENGLTKADVRALARHLELPNWDKPALACLASRLPYGTRVTPERLAAVDLVEQHLRGLGFRQVRARHHGENVHLEVEADAVKRLQGQVEAGQLDAVLRAAGFGAALVEPSGYLQGRLNGSSSAQGKPPCSESPASAP